MTTVSNKDVKLAFSAVGLEGLSGSLLSKCEYPQNSKYYGSLNVIIISFSTRYCHALEIKPNSFALYFFVSVQVLRWPIRCTFNRIKWPNVGKPLV